MTQQPLQRQSLTLLEIAQAWRRGDLYARLLLMLYYANRVAPSPFEARAKMWAEIENTAQRVKRYEEVKRLQVMGMSISAIGRQMGMHRETVRRFIRADEYPEARPPISHDLKCG
jgi:DNA-binding NarL/FixJ family response regulator